MIMILMTEFFCFLVDDTFLDVSVNLSESELRRRNVLKFISLLDFRFFSSLLYTVNYD